VNDKIKESSAAIFEKIIKQAIEELDLLASYHHYLVWDEIKILRKGEEYAHRIRNTDRK